MIGGRNVHDLTHLDLCSGLGMFALAAEWAQFRTIGFAEIDPHCKKVLVRRWAHVPNYGDIKTAKWGSATRNVCLLTAGYPCQPFSSPGKQLGEKDHRHLWPSVRRAVKENRPDWFVGENVIGHIDLGLDQVLSDLEDLDYTAQPLTIPACAVGADFVGERVWVLASSNLLRLRGGTRQWARIRPGRVRLLIGFLVLHWARGRKTHYVNPAFLERVLGVPPGHSAIPRSAMSSSRRSRIRSSRRSTK